MGLIEIHPLKIYNSQLDKRACILIHLGTVPSQSLGCILVSRVLTIDSKRPERDDMLNMVSGVMKEHLDEYEETNQAVNVLYTIVNMYDDARIVIQE